MRRLQDTLTIAGYGVIAFSVWGIAKAMLLFAFSACVDWHIVKICCFDDRTISTDLPFKADTRYFPILFGPGAGSGRKPR